VYTAATLFVCLLFVGYRATVIPSCSTDEGGTCKTRRRLTPEFLWSNRLATAVRAQSSEGNARETRFPTSKSPENSNSSKIPQAVKDQALTDE
jgi:hypothetical protein